jgi:hypothetical protein
MTFRDTCIPLNLANMQITRQLTTPPRVDFRVAGNPVVNTFFAGTGFLLAKVPLRRICYCH